MNSPKNTAAQEGRTDAASNESRGSNTERSEQDRNRDIRSDEEDDALLGTRHKEEDEDELPLSDEDGSSDLQEEK